MSVLYQKYLDKSTVLWYYSDMADANIAIAATLVHEGGYVNNPSDPGGATNMGITQADMPGQDMRMLTVAQATAYYLQHYWKPFYSQIVEQAVASKLFDMGVLFGVGTAVKILQVISHLPADGSFGPMTLNAVNQAGANLLETYRAAMLRRVDNVIARNPAEEIFRTGWTRRINS